MILFRLITVSVWSKIVVTLKVTNYHFDFSNVIIGENIVGDNPDCTNNGCLPVVQDIKAADVTVHEGWNPGVDFPNILRAAFLYKSLFQSFFLRTFWLCNFFGNRILAQKAAHKMLVKFTTEKIFAGSDIALVRLAEPAKFYFVSLYSILLCLRPYTH